MLAIQSISDYISSETCLDAEHNSEVDRPYIGINPKGDISHLRTRNTDCLATHQWILMWDNSLLYILPTILLNRMNDQYL